MTGVSIDAVAMSSYVPINSSWRGLRNFCVSFTLTATNFKIRYWVTTLRTCDRSVWLSFVTRGILRALESSMRRHASYSGRSGSIERVSGGATPSAFSTSIINRGQSQLPRGIWDMPIKPEITYLEDYPVETGQSGPTRQGSGSSTV